MSGQQSGNRGWIPKYCLLPTALCLLILAILPYGNALTADFTLDDQPQVRENPAVTEGIDLIGILSAPLFPGDLYRPFTVFTFALNEALTPGRPAAFHAVNVLLHAVVTLLVFALGLQLFHHSTAAAVGAALFAVHPVHTEAVTSIVGRAEVLAALCGLAALLSAMRADAATDAPTRRLWEAAALVAFILALCSKESALTLLPLLFWLRSARRGESLRRGMWNAMRSLDWLPYALCAAVFLIARFALVGAVRPPLPIQPLNNVLITADTAGRIRTALAVLWDNFALLNLPVVLSADYSLAQITVVNAWSDPRFLAGSAVILAAVLFIARSRHAGLRFAAAFPLVTMLLTANLFFPIGTIRAERLLYLPSTGWALLVGYGAHVLLGFERYRRRLLAAMALIVAAYAMRTWQRNWDWQNNLALYRSMAIAAPNSAKARHNRGVVAQREGRHAEAITAFQDALAVYPYTESAVGIAISESKLERVDDAIASYRAALRIIPSYAKAHTNLCAILLDHERFAEAEHACRNGLRYRPTDAHLLSALGMSFIGSGEKAKGELMLQRADAIERLPPRLQAYFADDERRALLPH